MNGLRTVRAALSSLFDKLDGDQHEGDEGYHCATKHDDLHKVWEASKGPSDPTYGDDGDINVAADFAQKSRHDIDLHTNGV
jgi:hypothetical protein